MENITLEKIDILRDRAGVTYKEAKEALERSNGDVIEALIELEEAKQGTWTDEISSRSSQVIERVKKLIYEGNVTKIRVKNEGKVLVEIPVAIGALGAVMLPHLAVLGVLVAVFKRCTIEIVRTDGDTETIETEVEQKEEEKKKGL
ncbi:MAG: DUF4342 domain-containing protein [Negativicutes bacterium]